MKSPTRVIAYIRVSTESQADGGVSLEAQREQLEAYAKGTRLQLVDIVEDAGRSAKTLKRPGLQLALERLKNGEADGLLVVKLDRLTRSVRDLATLIDGYFSESAGFSLLAAEDSIDTRSAAGRLVLNVLTSVGQWEREACAERTSTALQHLKRQGVRLGALPIGQSHSSERDADGRCLMVQNTGELQAVNRIRELRSKGDTLQGIADTLTSEGHRTKRGGQRWYPSTVRNVLGRAA